MSGNVWEWVQDCYDKDYYEHSPRDNPLRSGYGYYRVIRGGSLESGPESLRTTRRHMMHPLAAHGIGFRLVLSAKNAPGVVIETQPTKLKDIGQSVTESLVSQPDSTNSEAKSYITLQPTAHKGEGRADGQSVKPTHGGLGVGGKIGLTITVLLITTIVNGVLSDLIGRKTIWAIAIASSIIFYIWFRPWKKRQ